MSDETSHPYDGFPAPVWPDRAEDITNLDDLSHALFATYLDVRALAWMQYMVAQQFVEPADTDDRFGLDRISLFQTSSTILARALVERADLLSRTDLLHKFGVGQREGAPAAVAPMKRRA